MSPERVAILAIAIALAAIVLAVMALTGVHFDIGGPITP